MQAVFENLEFIAIEAIEPVVGGKPHESPVILADRMN